MRAAAQIDVSVNVRVNWDQLFLAGSLLSFSDSGWGLGLGLGFGG